MGTIVCAVDDSQEAEEALRVAARLSDDAGLRLVVAHVEEPVHTRSVRGTSEQRGRQLLDRLLATQSLAVAPPWRQHHGAEYEACAVGTDHRRPGVVGG